MKAILFLCLLVCLTCNDAIDAGKCLLNIPNFKEEVTNVLEAIKSKNIKEVLKAAESATTNIKDAAIDCINKVNAIKGLICKYPIKNLKCLVQCGLPDDSPRYCKCYENCRNNYCL